jgi:hypothetical protein
LRHCTITETRAIGASSRPPIRSVDHEALRDLPVAADKRPNGNDPLHLTGAGFVRIDGFWLCNQDGHLIHRHEVVRCVVLHH